MKKIAVYFAAVLFAAASFGDIANPGYPITNAVYATTAGYALTSADGTNALAQLVTETNRAKVAETAINTNLLALLVIETNRAILAEAGINTTATNANVVAAAAKIAGTNAQARVLVFESVSGVTTQKWLTFTNVYNGAGILISHTP